MVESSLLWSVLQGPTEKEQIDVQGDISYDIVEFITDTWPDVSCPSSLHFIMFTFFICFHVCFFDTVSTL